MSDVGISIEGIGTEIEAGDKGTIFGWSGIAPGVAIDYTWKDGLTEAPTIGKDEADPRDGSMTLAGFVAKLHARPSIRRLLLARQDNPEHTLQSSISDSQTTITLEVAGVSGAIWIGDETLRIVSDDGGGDYTVERGFWDSDAGAHGEGAGVYTRPPYYKNRLVTYWQHVGGSLRQRGRGYLDRIRTEQAQTRIVVNVEGPLSAMQDVTRLRANRALDAVLFCNQGEGQKSVSMQWDRSDFASNIAKPLDASGNPSSDWYFGGTNIISEPEKFAYGQFDGAIEPLYDGAHYDVPLFKDEVEGNETETDSVGPIDDAVYELAVWNRHIPKAPYPIADAEQVFDNVFQPLAVCAALLCSGDEGQIDPQRLDFVNGSLGLGIGWLIGSEGRQAFIDLANKDSGISIDHLYLGWDGDPVNVLDVVMDIMVSYGYWLTPSVDGFLIPRRFDSMTIEDLANAAENQIEMLYPLQSPPRIIQEPGYGRILQTYTASIGETDVYEGTNAEGRAIGASARIDKMIDPVQNDLDFNTLRTDRSEEVIDILIRQAAFLRANMPTLKISANDWAIDDLNYDVGEWATVSVPFGSDDVLYDEAGESVSGATLLEHPFVMMITGRGWNTTTDAYELDGLLVNFTRRPGRFIAPEAIVESFRLEGGTFQVLEIDQSGGVALPEDEFEFSVGQQIQLVDSDLKKRASGVREVEAIGTGEIWVSPVFDVDPEPGDVVRLAQFDDYTHSDFGYFRGYAYMSDANDELGSSGEEADEWQ